MRERPHTTSVRDGKIRNARIPRLNAPSGPNRDRCEIRSEAVDKDVALQRLTSSHPCALPFGCCRASGRTRPGPPAKFRPIAKHARDFGPAIHVCAQIALQSTVAILRPAGPTLELLRDRAGPGQKVVPALGIRGARSDFSTMKNFEWRVARSWHAIRRTPNLWQLSYTQIAPRFPPPRLTAPDFKPGSAPVEYCRDTRSTIRPACMRPDTWPGTGVFQARFLI